MNIMIFATFLLIIGVTKLCKSYSKSKRTATQNSVHQYIKHLIAIIYN